jgi:hypothetical protein
MVVFLAEIRGRGKENPAVNPWVTAQNGQKANNIKVDGRICPPPRHPRDARSAHGIGG